MEPILITTAAMALLNPFLKKAGEKAAETIGEKIATSTIESSIWRTIRSVFIEENIEPQIADIENKPIASQADIVTIETKLTEAVQHNPKIALNLQTALAINSTNEFLVSLKLNSIEKLKTEIEILEEEIIEAGPSIIGDLKIRLRQQQRTLNYQVEELRKLLH